MAENAERTQRIHITHVGFEERALIAREQYYFPRSAENVGVSAGLSAVQPISHTMVSEWMDSSGHRKNILQHWDAAGIGVSQARNGLGVYVTQMFGAKN